MIKDLIEKIDNCLFNYMKLKGLNSIIIDKHEALIILRVKKRPATPIRTFEK